MADLPDVAVLVGFGSTWRTAEGDIDWTDITEWVMWEHELVWSRGRSSRFQQFSPGKAAFTLLNTDRRFDPDNAAGPWFGMLLPNTPLKIVGHRPGADYYTDYYLDVYLGPVEMTWPLWRGFVDDWRQSTPNEIWSEMPISCTDGLGILARCGLPSSWYALTVLRDAPKAWWRLGAKADGDAMLDSSGNGADGSISNANFGLDSLVNDPSDRAVSIEHTVDGRGVYHDTAGRLPTGPPFSVEMWLQGGRLPGAFEVALSVDKDNTNGSGLWIYVYEGTDSPDGEIVVSFAGLGGQWKRRGSTRIDDSQVHHVVVSCASTSSLAVYVDGQAEALTTISGSAGGTWPGHLYWVVGNLMSGTGDFGVHMTIDEVAVYDRALSAAEALEHWEAGTSGAPSDGADWLNGLLDHVGWPAGQRDIGAFDTPLGSGNHVLADRMLAQAQKLDLSEQGRQFVNAAGELVQRPRYWFLTTATAPVVTFSDDGSGCFFSDPQFGSPTELIRNRATGNRPGGPSVEASDEASIVAFGENEVPFGELYAPSDTGLRSTFEWIVARYKDPKTRVDGLTVDLLENEEFVPELLALDCDQRVAVEITPASTGAQSAFELAVDWLEHRRGALTWTVKAQLSPFDTDSGFGRWGSGVWGTALWA